MCGVVCECVHPCGGDSSPTPSTHRRSQTVQQDPHVGVMATPPTATSTVDRVVRRRVVSELTRFCEQADSDEQHHHIVTAKSTPRDVPDGDGQAAEKKRSWVCCGQQMMALADVHRHLTSMHAHCLDDASLSACAAVRQVCDRLGRKVTAAVAKGPLLSWQCVCATAGPCQMCGWPAQLTVTPAIRDAATRALGDDSDDGELCGASMSMSNNVSTDSTTAAPQRAADGEPEPTVLEAHAAACGHLDRNGDDDDGGVGVILLFYHYCEVPQPEVSARALRSMCADLGLVGKIRVAHEGLNGSVSGTHDAAQRFVDAVLALQPFAKGMRRVNFLRSAGPQCAFEALEVVIVPEIITLGIEPSSVPASAAAEHLSPAEFHDAALAAAADPSGGTVILDVRNFFESRIGRFNNAVCPDVRKFSYFPGYLEANADLFRDKRVLMYVVLIHMLLWWCRRRW